MRLTLATLKKQKLRNNEYYDNQQVLDDLYLKSQNNEVFNKLMPLILDENNILMAYRNLKKNFGSVTPGTDGRTIDYFKDKSSEYIVKYVRSRLNFYVPQSIRRIEIPKKNGKTRPLGIPTIGDRLVQQCILQIMEPIAEAHFYKHSYGFRPARSAENAIGVYYKMIQQMKMHYVVDVDIKGFFDNIDHGKLLKQLWTMGFRDKKLISIISCMLKAEVANIGFPDKGTPQGGIISPLLANIVLNELDWWVAKQWECFPTKYDYKHNKTQNDYDMPKNKRKALKRSSELKEGYIIRYADDFKIVCKSYETANKWFFAVKDWLNQRLGLEISPEKSKIVNLSTDYSEFLGLKIKITRKGFNARTKVQTPKYVVESHITDDNIKRIQQTAMGRIHDIIKEGNPDSLISKIAKYNAFVIGMHNYYNMATHVVKDLNKIDFIVLRTLEHRVGGSIKSFNPNTDSISSYIYDKYGKSKRLKMFHGHPLVPISYVQHSPPHLTRGDTTIYTPEGRQQIHKNLNENLLGVLAWLSRNPVVGQTVEYNDNRLSLYVAQGGKCAILGTEIDIDRIHCHHIIPKEYGGTDEYSNLIIVDKNMHILIHATKEETITKYLGQVTLTKKQLEKLNKLRSCAKTSLIKCNNV